MWRSDQLRPNEFASRRQDLDRVPRPSRVLRRVGGLFSGLLDLIHGQQHDPSPEVKRIATPRPLPRMLRQGALHRIHVHVMKLLIPFLLAPNVKVVKPLLPEMRQPDRLGVETQR